jgi:NB-ARC domain/APAF-1 helical domain
MQELSAERQVVKRALGLLGVAAWVFEEDAGARSTTIRQTYLDALSKADIYIGLFWKSCGQYTIDEFRHAKDTLHLDCLIYEKQVVDGRREPGLQEFLDELGRVESGVTVQRYADLDELDGYLRRDIAAWQADKIHERTATRFDSPFQAPPLGDSYIERQLVLQDLKRRLLPSPDSHGKHIKSVVLYGPPGVGKTVIASAFAHDEEIAAAFPDGVLWLSLGEAPDLIRSLSEWGRAIPDPRLSEQGYPDLEAAVGRLRSLLRDRSYLLVVDDAWTPAHIEQAFLVGGTRCLLLVTTRHVRIASKIGAEGIELAPMVEKEALELMSRWAGQISPTDEPIARTLAQEVGYLPLALELIGARVGTLSSWPAYQERWRTQRLQALTRGRGSRGRQDSVRDSLELSLKLLSDEDRQRYIRLGVFAPKGLFPASAAATLWDYDPLEAEELLIDWAGQAILSRRRTESGIRFGFHDLLYDFVLEQMGDTGLLYAHETLLQHYCRGHPEWSSVPDDGYFFDHLSYHLIQAHRGNELVTLLTTAPDWMNAKAAALQSFAQRGDKVVPWWIPCGTRTSPAA